MIMIGIDPGKSGGLAALDQRGEVLGVVNMPDDERGIFSAILYLRADNSARDTRVIIERVHASPQQGVVSAFTFGLGYGRLLMAAYYAGGIEPLIVTPRTWQKAMGCLTGGDKAISRARAQEIFRGIQCTHAISDALLLAEYLRRLHVAAAQ